MAMSQIGQVKVISESFVKPNYEVEVGVGASVSNQQPPAYYYLGPMDLVPLSHDYMHRGMLYSFTNTLHATSDHHHHQSSTSYDDRYIESFLEKLKHSLSLCLVHFCPLAGQLATQKFPDDHASLIFVDCTKDQQRSRMAIFICTICSTTVVLMRKNCILQITRCLRLLLLGIGLCKFLLFIVLEEILPVIGEIHSMLRFEAV
uniref:Uncharacterized protein n=1 Tax=Opuntia streptacantha TaxID=393608 RepID=A0A7C9DRQ3_OPUST